MGATATTGTLSQVETFAVGVYPGDAPGEVWAFTAADLAEITRNFWRLSAGPRPLHRVPVVVTHDGRSAFGWVNAARYRAGILFTDWEQIDPVLEKAIKAGRFRKVSAEVKPDFMDRAGRHYGQYLYRVAVLGADVPRVKGLADIPATFADPAPGRRFVRALKFAEARNMADTATVDDKRKAVGDYYSLPQDLIDSFSDDQVEMGATAILKEAAGGDGAPAADAPADGTVTAAEGDSATMSREELVAALTDLGEDPAALDALSDDELRARYDELMGAGGAVMSEQTGTPKQAAPAAAQTFADPAAVTRVIDTAVRRGLAQISRAGKAAAEAREKAAAADAARAHDAKCRTFGDEMVRTGIWAPADIDESNPRVLCKLQQLLRLDDTQVRTFKECRTTDLDAAMEEIRRQKPRKFSERVAQPVGGAESVSPDRRRELLGHTTLGRSILAAERKKN
jgi:hypothetical protein